MILDAIEQVGGIYVVTADHGNAEDMVKRNKSGKPQLDKNGNIQVLTSHTLQPVSLVRPFSYFGIIFRSSRLIRNCNLCTRNLKSVVL